MSSALVIGGDLSPGYPGARRCVRLSVPKGIAYGFLLTSDYCQRVYLDQLPDHLSVSLGLVQLMVTSQGQAPERARQLISQATATPHQFSI